MTRCRNEEMNKGGSYPRSCPTCKWSGICSEGVERDPDSNIDPQYYIPVKTKEESTMQYAAVIKVTRHEDDGYYGYSAKTHLEFVEFSTEENLVKWIEDNNASTNRKEVVKYLKFQEVKTEIKVTLVG